MCDDQTKENVVAAVDFSVRSLATGRAYVHLITAKSFEAPDVHAILARIAATPDLDAQAPTLWDFRAFDFETCNLAACRRNVLDLMNIPERKGAPRACLVGSELGYGVLRMVQEVVSGHGVDDLDAFHVTYSLEDALEWLDRRALTA